MKLFAINSLTLAALAILPALATAATTVTVSTSKDAMIFGAPTTTAGVYSDTGKASGNAPNFFAGADGSGNVKRAEIQFDLSSIPADATITAVTMKLTIGNVAGSGGSSSSTDPLNTRTFGLYDLLQSWGEGPSGLSAGQNPASPGGTGQGTARTTGDSTWDYAIYNANPALAVLWNAGAAHGGYFASTPSDTATFTASSTSPFAVGQVLSWSSAGILADVQAWVSGAATNNGWLLKSENLETNATSFLGFWSKEGAAANANPALAPALTITYVTPEPAAALLLVAAPLFLRRRTNARRA